MNGQTKSRKGFKLSLLAAAVMGASGLIAAPQYAVADDCVTDDDLTTCTGDSSQNLQFGESPHAVVIEENAVVVRLLPTAPIIDMNASGALMAEQTTGFGLFSVENLGTLGSDDDAANLAAIRVRGNPDAEDAADAAVGVTSFNLINVGTITRDQHAGSNPLVDVSDLGGDVSIDNSGSIDGNVSVERIGGDLLFGNSGEIAGNAAAKDVEGSVSFSNSGIISNQVQIQDIGGDLLLDNSGEIADNQVRILRVSGDINLNNSGTIERLFINQAGSQGGDLSISNAEGGRIERLQNFNNLFRVDSESTSETVVDDDITTTVESSTSEVVGGHFALTNSGTIGAVEMNAVPLIAEVIEGTGLDVDNAGGDIVIENTATGEIFFKKRVTLNSRTTLADVETTTVVDDSGDDTVTTVTSVLSERTVGGNVSLINAGLIQDETETGNDIELRAAGNVLLQNSGTIDYTVSPCCQDIIASAGGIDTVVTVVEVDGVTVSDSQQQHLVASDLTFTNSGTVNVTALISSTATGNIVLENTDQGMISYNDFWGAFAGAALENFEFSADVDADGVITETFTRHSEAAGGELSFLNAGSLQSVHGGSMGLGANGGLSFGNSGSIGSAADPLSSVFLTAGERESQFTSIDVFGAGTFSNVREDVISVRVSDLAFENSGALWAGSLSLGATGNVMATNTGTLALGRKTLNLNAGSIDSTDTFAFSSDVEEDTEDGVTTSVFTSTDMSAFDESVVAGQASLVNAAGAMVTGPVSITATADALLDNAGTFDLGSSDLDVRAGSVLASINSQASIVSTIISDDDLNAPLFESVTASFSETSQEMAAPGSIDFINRAGGEINCSMGCGGNVNLNAVGNVSFQNFGFIGGDVNVDNIAVLTAITIDDFESEATSFERFDSNEDGVDDATRPTEQVVMSRSSFTLTQELAQGEVSIDNQGTIAGALNVRDQVTLSNSSISSAQTTTTAFEAGEATRRSTDFEQEVSSTNTDEGGHGGGISTNEANGSIGRVDIDTTEDAGLDNLGTVIGNVRINTVGSESSESESESSRFVQDLRMPPTPLRSFFLDVDDALIVPAVSSHPGPRFVLEDPDAHPGGLPGFLGSDADLDPDDGPFIEASSEQRFESTLTNVGGRASLNNVSFDSIGGNVVITGLNEASANNSGLIRGNVDIDAGGSASTIVDTGSFERLAPVTDDDAGTVTVVDTASVVVSASDSVIAGAASLDNSGTIGEVSIDASGNIDIRGGRVDVSATETAVVNNSGTGLIYGIVAVRAGATESTLEETGAWEHQTVLDADSGDELSRVGSFSGQSTETRASTASSAMVVNEGEIGRQLIQTNGIAVSRVGTHTVIVQATDASMINTGSVLSGMVVAGSGFSSANAATLDIDFNSVTDENGVTTQNVVQLATDSATEGGIGATAQLQNAGTIGGPELGRSMSVVVAGQAAATLENTGAITGSDVFSSFIEVTAESTVLSLEQTESFQQTQVDGLTVATETLVDNLETESRIGGAALLANSGSISVDNVAISGAPAMLTNSGTLTTGVVSVNSSFTDISEQTITTNTMSASAPSLVAVQRSDSRTQTGGVASVENTGTLNAAIVLEGFEAATLVNAANAGINGSVTANARGTDTTFESDTLFQAGEQTGSFTSTATQVGGVAAVANAGTIDGNVTANGFAGSELNNAVTGLITGNVTLGGKQGSYVDTINQDGVVTQTLAGPALGEDGTETVLANAGVILGSVNARAFNLNTVDNSGQMGSLTVSAFGSSNEIDNSGVIMGSIHANAGDTNILNTGIITGSVNFNAAGSTNTLTMASGAHITTGSITAATDPSTGENLTSTGIELQGLGLFSGNISGAESLIKNGEGTWVLTGSGSSGLNPTTATYDIAEIDIVAGGIQFGGSFGQAGPTPGSPFMQPAFLAGNTALDPRFLDVVNDTLAGADRFGTNSVINVEGDINVGAAGALSGEFAVFGNLNVGGTFTPGFVGSRSNPRIAGPGQLPFIAPGQVQIEGDYTLAGGTHAIGFGPALRNLGGGAFGEETLGTNMTTVSGDVSADGTLSVLVENGLYVDGQSADFLRVTGELNAQGLAVSPTSNPRFVNFGVTTSEDEGVTVASITATRNSFTTAATSENEAAAAGALDVSVSEVVNTLETADRDSDAFRSATMLGRIIAQLDFGGLSDEQVRATFGDFAPGFLASLNSLDVSRPVLSSTMRRASGRFVAAEQERGLAGWAEGHLLNDRMDGSGGAAGIQADFHGLSAGLEARDVNSLIGLAFGVSDISVKGRGNTDRADVRSKTLGLYSGYRNGPWTVNGQVGFTWSNFETRRALGGMLPGVISGPAGASVAMADYDSTEWNVSAQLAYDFILDNGVTVSPLGELRYRGRSVDSFREEVGGVALLDVESNSGNMWIPTIGVEASTELSFGDWNVRPMGGLRYAFVPSSDEEIAVRMIGTNAVYETQGAQMDDQLVVNAGVELDRNNLSIFGGTNIGFTGDQRTFQFNAGLRYRF